MLTPSGVVPWKGNADVCSLPTATTHKVHFRDQHTPGHLAGPPAPPGAPSTLTRSHPAGPALLRSSLARVCRSGPPADRPLLMPLDITDSSGLCSHKSECMEPDQMAWEPALSSGH